MAHNTKATSNTKEIRSSSNDLIHRLNKLKNLYRTSCTDLTRRNKMNTPRIRTLCRHYRHCLQTGILGQSSSVDTIGHCVDTTGSFFHNMLLGQSSSVDTTGHCVDTT
ncbi:hypothetical protein Taro_013173, partial [Colocasia esculenta]|nr:hypothetical protein [Colocasia esculenta]